MPTKFNIDSIIRGGTPFGLPFCVDVFSARLPATTDTTLTVPSEVKGNYIVVFGYSKPQAASKDVWVAVGEAATVPAGGTFAASSSELNPSAKYVKSGDVIHMIAVTDDTDVSVAFYLL